jgi:hypothetical protein
MSNSSITDRFFDSDINVIESEILELEEEQIKLDENVLPIERDIESRACPICNTLVAHGDNFVPVGGRILHGRCIQQKMARIGIYLNIEDISDDRGFIIDTKFIDFCIKNMQKFSSAAIKGGKDCADDCESLAPILVAVSFHSNGHGEYIKDDDEMYHFIKYLNKSKKRAKKYKYLLYFLNACFPF